MTANGDHTQELTDKINESITALCAETDAAKQNETYRAWLDTLSRFYSYSFNNWLLIYSQRPDAIRVAGFQTWKSLGRFVKKGERGIRIFAPIIRKIEEEKNGATEQVSRPVGFRSIAVFALEQTDGEALPEIDSNATEGGEELLPRLEATTASLGIQLVYKAIPGAAEGLSKGGLIRSRRRFPPLHAAESSSMSWPMNCNINRTARRRLFNSVSWRPSPSAMPSLHTTAYGPRAASISPAMTSPRKC